MIIRHPGCSTLLLLPIRTGKREMSIMLVEKKRTYFFFHLIQSISLFTSRYSEGEKNINFFECIQPLDHDYALTCIRVLLKHPAISYNYFFNIYFPPWDYRFHKAKDLPALYAEISEQMSQCLAQNVHNINTG